MEELWDPMLAESDKIKSPDWLKSILAKRKIWENSL